MLGNSPATPSWKTNECEHPLLSGSLELHSPCVFLCCFKNGKDTIPIRCPHPPLQSSHGLLTTRTTKKHADQLILVSLGGGYCSVTKSYLTLCDPMGFSKPGFPVLHHLPELAQTHVHWVGDTIQPPHPLSPTSSPAFNLSQHQGLFQSISSLHQVAKVCIGTSASASVLPMNIHGWFPLGLTGLISLLPKGPSRVFSSTTIQKHQFLGTQPSLWSNSHIHTWLVEKLLPWLYGPLSARWCLCFLYIV